MDPCHAVQSEGERKLVEAPNPAEGTHAAIQGYYNAAAACCLRLLHCKDSLGHIPGCPETEVQSKDVEPHHDVAPRGPPMRGELLEQRVHHVLEAACPCMHHIPLWLPRVLRRDEVPEPKGFQRAMNDSLQKKQTGAETVVPNLYLPILAGRTRRCRTANVESLRSSLTSLTELANASKKESEIPQHCPTMRDAMLSEVSLRRFFCRVSFLH